MKSMDCLRSRAPHETQKGFDAAPAPLGSYKALGATKKVLHTEAGVGPRLLRSTGTISTWSVRERQTF